MAIIEVKVPELSESVAEGTLIQWHKKTGEPITTDEVLVEIETDKVVLEVPSPGTGILVEILVQNGGTVASQQVIAKIDAKVTAKAKSATMVAALAESSAAVDISTVSKAGKFDKAGVAMPAAAKLLAENNLSALQVAGTGKGGRVTKGDVLDTLIGKAKVDGIRPDSSSIMPPLDDRAEVREPMSRLRIRVAERLLESQQNTASLTTFNEVNMAPVMDLRKKFQDQFVKANNVKLGFMSFFVKAAVYALKKFPIVNASIDGTDLVFHNFFDIGVAISSSRGLVVPVLRNADKLSFAEIEQKIAEFAIKAQEGKLTMAEISGGTFTITNGGTFGSMMSTPIINPPQSAILGIHATKERAVVENGEIVIRPMCYVALSYDHRIIDGRESVLSLVAMKEALEDPTRILIGL